MTVTASSRRSSELLSRMADNSNIVLHWEIDNATATFDTGKAESGIFDEGGFRWTATVAERTDTIDHRIDFSLRCDLDHNGPWSCEGEVGVHMFCAEGRYLNCVEDRFSFNNNSFNWENISDIYWFNLPISGYKINDKVTIEFRIKIVSSERSDPIVDPAKFAVPNSRSDVILKIGEEKLHVSKELLALHSPVFETMFFGNFAEKGKVEVEIKEVVYEEFLDLLHLIYLEPVEITDRSVEHILKLADQFQMERVLTLSMKHLKQSKGLDVMKKLMIADQYRLTSLKDYCLNSFTSATDLTAKLKSFPELDNFSEAMHAAICKRIVKLT